MELDLQKAILNNKQYYIVPEEIFPHLKLSAKEQKGLLKMEFGDKFYLVPILVTDEKPSSDKIDNSVSYERIHDLVSEIFTNNIDSREETSSSSGSCGKTSSSSGSCGKTSSSSGCGVATDDPCGRTFWSRSSGCGYEPDPCGGTFWGRSSSC